MGKIKSEIDSFITRVLTPSKKELRLIEEVDWTNISNQNMREEEFDLQNMLTNRAIKNMKELYNMAEKSGDLSKAKVKNALKLLRSFFTIMDGRYSKYSEDDSWMKIDGDLGDKERSRAVDKRTFEISFGSKILKSITSYESILRDINDGDESNEVSIPLYGNAVIPLVMEKKAIKTYPEISKAIKLMEEEDE